MKVLGLITEYNPFHNGHLHHLQESLKSSGADYSVAVMSGHFVQRGEPAIFDKWTRAAMAVNCGVDLIIELPTVFAVSSAEYFSFGAVDLLNKLGIVTDLIFGSESGDIRTFENACDYLSANAKELDQAIGKHLISGISYPSARQAALADLATPPPTDLSDLISSPNNILGLEYLKALRLLNSSIKAGTIHRIGSDYNSAELEGRLSSATAIRRHLYTAHHPLHVQDYPLNDVIDNLRHIIPDQALKTLKKLSHDSDFQITGPIFPDDFEEMLFYRLRSMTTQDLSKIHDVREGLENRIKEQARLSCTLEELTSGIKSKRYALTRIQRILIKTLLNIEDSYIGKTADLRPQYARILAFNDKGRELIARMRKSSAVPILTRPGKQILTESASTMLSFDFLASDIYALCSGQKQNKKGGRDYTQPPVYVR